MSDITFKYSAVLYLLALIPLMLFLVYRLKSKKSIKVSSILMFDKKKRSLKYHLRYVSDILRAISLILIVVAMARPIKINDFDEKVYEGIDIVMALDISGSMLADDFTPNRLKIAKQKAIDFISKRPGDRIGVVVYAGEAFTLSPPTSDKAFLIDRVSSLKTGIITDGTAIGVGLATAVNSLTDTAATERIIILLSDGANNSGTIDPETATEIAATLGIKVYTIGVGRTGKARVPENADGSGNLIEVDVSLDEPALIRIAERTGGKYFSAVNAGMLNDVYNEINKLEKSKFTIVKRTDIKDLFVYFAIPALLLLLLEFVLRSTIIRVYP